MIKYAKNDIIEGIKSLTIGIGNIISTIIRGDISEYVINEPINYLLVVGAIKTIFPNAELKYSDKFIIITLESVSIRITFSINSIKFNLE